MYEPETWLTHLRGHGGRILHVWLRARVGRSLNGPDEHDSLRKKFYCDDPEQGIIVAGASAHSPKRRRSRKNPAPGNIFIKSSVFGHDERANRVLFDCCPPQVLQGHKVFGHGKLLHCCYAIFLQRGMVRPRRPKSTLGGRPGG